MILAGFASLLLTPSEPVPLAGYASAERRLERPDFGDHAWTFFKPSRGVRDDVTVTAMVLEVGGARYAIVGVDLIAVDSGFVAAVAEASGLPAEHLVIGASHTHSGPGALSKTFIWQALALDRYNARIEEHVVKQTAAAIRSASSRLQPVQIAVGDGDLPAGTLWNRRRLPELKEQMTVVRVDALDGSPMGLVYNAPIHGTSLGAENLEISADNIGETRRAIEAKIPGAAVLYLNGAEGDVSPGDDVPARMSEAAYAIWERLRPSSDIDFSWRASTVALPKTQLHLTACDAETYAHFATPIPLPFQLSEDEALLRAFRLGAHTFVTVPGEAITRVGAEIEAAVPGAVVVGLANGYAGYILTQSEYERGGYESCASTYGAGFGRFMTEAVVANATFSGPPSDAEQWQECTRGSFAEWSLAFLPLLRRRRHPKHQ